MKTNQIITLQDGDTAYTLLQISTGASIDRLLCNRICFALSDFNSNAQLHALVTMLAQQDFLGLGIGMQGSIQLMSWDVAPISLEERNAGTNELANFYYTLTIHYKAIAERIQTQLQIDPANGQNLSKAEASRWIFQER